MISNARGKHSSPGVYMEEIDKTYATKSLGITTLGLVGETLKGPAFEPIRISDWSEFQDYFGGTSTEKFVGTKLPKYELPYIAKSYLKESKNLEVCRVLGLSGYNAGNAWMIYGKMQNKTEKYPIAILRSKATYSSESSDTEECNGNDKYDKLSFIVTGISTEAYTTISSELNGCNFNNSSSTTSTFEVSKNNYGKLTLKVTGTKGLVNIPVSLNPSHKDYIVNVIGMDAQNGDYPIFIEEMYDLAHIKSCDTGLYNTIGVEIVTDKDANIEIMSNYLTKFRYASTPWFVSEIKGNTTNMEMKKLFRFHTISDGNAANSQIKISIENILPDEGLFDVLIRDFNDTDNMPVVLERFSKCSMYPGISNYIGLKIGTFNGDYENKSKYVTVEVIESDLTSNCVPCGFLGYPLRKYASNSNIKTPVLSYNDTVYDTIKVNRQYFGLSDISGVDVDVFKFKGSNAYYENQHPDNGYTQGFHLDSLLNVTAATLNITVDGVSGYSFTTPEEKSGDFKNYKHIPHIASESEMEDTLFSDKRYRKFTCYPYGGFDGWDIYRNERTNSDMFKSNKYKGLLNDYKKDNDDKFITTPDGNKIMQTEYPFTDKFDAEIFGLLGKFNSSDYYAYLAGYKQFDNPNKIKINLLATPGIDYVNNLGLFNEVLDIVEDSRQGDCLYIVTTPDTDNGYEVDAETAVSMLDAQEISTSYAATYYPWVKYYDESNKKYINLPVTKDVVRNFAYTDNVAHPWFASAGMSRGNVDCVKASHFTKLEEEDILYEGMINPVKSFGSEGVKIWGNKTMYKNDTPLNRINVRRLMIRIKELVMSAAKQLIFEQNDNTVDSQFRSIVDPILSNAKQNRGISDYKIKTDTSAEARDRKELPAAIHIKPINCLEYIPITFTIYPEGAKFEE